MSFDTPITRDNLDAYLKDLAKEFRKLNGTKTHGEIILIGGAAVLANYRFREMTYDVDALIIASSAMKDAINRVGDKHGLPNGWLNADFRRTKSHSDRLIEVSTYYKTFSNVLTVRTVTAEHLIAMKLMSGRQYKNDLSDIAGILFEHQKQGTPIARETIDKAIAALYGESAKIPETARTLLDNVYSGGDLESLYRLSRENEIKFKEALLDFKAHYPGKLNDENINTIIESARRKNEAKISGLAGESLTDKLTAATKTLAESAADKTDAPKDKSPKAPER
jgi:predicted nucleotidyltransferase